MHYVYEQNGKQGVIVMQPKPAQSHQEAENEDACLYNSDATQCQEPVPSREESSALRKG